MASKEIIVKKDMLTLKFGDKKIPLVYRIREYQKLSNQSKEYIRRLRENKIKVKYFKYMDDNNNVVGIYYKLYSEKIVSFKYRKKLVEMILRKKYKNGLSLEEYIYKKYESPNWDKGINVESAILEILGSYLDIGHEKGYIPSKTYEYEVSTLHLFDSDNNDDESKVDNNRVYMIPNDLVGNKGYVLFIKRDNWGIRHLDKERYQKWIKKHKAQHRRWKQTSTYKFGILFTYDNHKDRMKDWDWINGQWVDYSDYHVRIERLINPERPYTFEWCYVDTDNMFTFKGKKYYISNEVKEYQKRDVRERDHRLEYPLDHIIVLEQDGNVYFFNSYGDRINNDLIKEVS